MFHLLNVFDIGLVIHTHERKRARVYVYECVMYVCMYVCAQMFWICILDGNYRLMILTQSRDVTGAECTDEL